MQIHDRYSQSGAPRERLKPNGRRSQHPENRSKGSQSIIPYKLPQPLLKLPWRESALSHTNGYSIAEILLVFGIIAGVLVTVWAMYTMLADEVGWKNSVAEVQMLRQAARQYKHSAKDGTYADVSMAGLAPYLGQGGSSDEYINVHGAKVIVYASTI